MATLRFALYLLVSTFAVQFPAQANAGEAPTRTIIEEPQVRWSGAQNTSNRPNLTIAQTNDPQTKEPSVEAPPAEPEVEIPAAVVDLIAPVERLKEKLESLVDEHEKSEKKDTVLLDQLARAERIISNSRALKSEMAPTLEEIKSSIGKLGPAPKRERRTH